jgi:hypothetical protein
MPPPATPAPAPGLFPPVPGRADPGAMTPAQFAAVLDALRWNNHALARALACDESLVRKWTRGATPVPPRVAYWLWSLADVMRLHPPPAEWRMPRPPGPRHGRVRTPKGKSRVPAEEKLV